MSADYDYVVIRRRFGLGSVLANRLSADRNNRVLLLEAGRPGPLSRPGHTRRPAVRRREIQLVLPRRTGSPPETGVEDVWSAGNVLGGSSAINGMMFVRGNPLDYDDWAQAGCTGWDYESVLPYFRRLGSLGRRRRQLPRRRRAGPRRSGARGTPPDGTVHRSRRAERHRANRGLQRGTPGRGGRRPDQHPQGAAPVRRPGLSAAGTKPPQPEDRHRRPRQPGFSWRATGPWGSNTSRAAAAAGPGAGGEVILCAGALISPKLLMLSGIGPTRTTSVRRNRSAPRSRRRRPQPAGTPRASCRIGP